MHRETAERVASAQWEGLSSHIYLHVGTQVIADAKAPSLLSGSKVQTTQHPGGVYIHI